MFSCVFFNDFMRRLLQSVRSTRGLLSIRFKIYFRNMEIIPSSYCQVSYCLFVVIFFVFVYVLFVMQEEQLEGNPIRVCQQLISREYLQARTYSGENPNVASRNTHAAPNNHSYSYC